MVNISQARELCKNKERGWHVTTNIEYAGISYLCALQNFYPHGNANTDIDENFYPNESGRITFEKRNDAGRILIRRMATGSGPEIWAHDGTENGIYDLNGNIWETAEGVRLVNGEIQIIPDNNAALFENWNDWHAVTSRGKLTKKFSANTWKFDSTKSDSEKVFKKIEGAIPFLSLTRQNSMHAPEEINKNYGTRRILRGVIDNDDYNLTRTTTIFDTDIKFFALQANGDFNKNISAAVGVFNIHNNANGLTLPSGAAYSPGGRGFFESGTEKNNTVFSAGLDYKFDDKFALGGIYSVGSAKITQQAQINARENPSEDNGFSIQFTYEQPQIKKKNNLAAWIAYRKLGRTGTYNPAFKGVGFGEQGLEIGARYNVLENVSMETIYFNGKKISKLAPPAPDADKPKIHKFYLSLNYEF